jgi:hypothetical protein
VIGSHYQVLLRELAEHGRTSYRELIQRYGQQGYTYNGFSAAVCNLRRRGIVAARQPGRYHADIVKTDAYCPCCGRRL